MRTSFLVKPIIALLIMLLAACANITSPSVLATTTPVQLAQPLIASRHEWITRWLNQTECAPPCWEGIVPGETLLKDAIALIEEIPEAIVTDQRDQSVEWEIARSDYGMALTNLKIGKPGNGSIFWVTIDIDKNQALVLEEAIHEFDFPSYVQVVSCAEEESLCDTNLIYSNVGMVLRLYLEMNLDGKVYVSERSTIVGLMFFIPGIETYMELSPYRYSSLKHWEGYGYYSQ